MSSRAVEFERFVALVEPRRRRALLGAVGPDRMPDAVSEAFAYCWENWERIVAMNEPAGSSIWLAARQLCPERFTDQDFESGPPGGFGGGFDVPESVQLGELPAGFPDFVDLSILDEHAILWIEHRQLIVSSSTALGADEAVEYFRTRFPDGWTVNEVLGPVTDRNGLLTWSLDIDGQDWTGMVEITSLEFEDLPRTTFVTIVLAAGGADPFARRALAVLYLDGTAALFESATETPVVTSDTELPQDLLDEPVRDVLFFDRSWLAAPCCEPVDGTIYEFGVTEWRPALTGLHMSLSPDGQRIAVSSSQGVKISTSLRSTWPRPRSRLVTL